MSPKLADSAVRQGDAIDSRHHPSAAVRRQLNKVFPTHWSFLLGEIALYSFIVLLITGVYLTLFFDPSMAEVTYNGVYQPLRAVEMSRRSRPRLTSASRCAAACSSGRSTTGPR
jgi:ubiquinol-cytochrome c reductase cytochrome b subunit